VASIRLLVDVSGEPWEIAAALIAGNPINIAMNDVRSRGLS